MDQHSWEEAPVLVLHPLLQQVGDDSLHLRFNMHVEIMRNLLISQDVLPRRNRLPELVVKPARHFQIQSREEHLMINVPAKSSIFREDSRVITHQCKKLSDPHNSREGQFTGVCTLASDDCYMLGSFPCQRVHSWYLRKYRAAAEHFSYRMQM